MVKGFRQIAVLTTLSRILGMVRDMTFAYFLGASGLMDGWAIAFKIPNLSRRLFGEGAAASSLIPIYSQQLRKDPDRAHQLASTLITVVCLLLIAVVLLAEIGIWTYYVFFARYQSTQLKLQLTATMLPYMVLICTTALLAGVLHAHRHFAAPAAAPILLNVCIITTLLVTGWLLKVPPARQVFAVAAAVVLAGLAQLLIQLPPLRAHAVKLRPCWQIHAEPFRKVMLLMGPMVLGLTATQINTLADDLVALWLSGSAEKGHAFTLFSSQIRYPLWEGAVSQLFYSQRLYQFPLGVLGISLATAVFPVMSAQAAAGNLKALCQTVARGLRCAVFIALPATAGLLLVARPLIIVLFERGRFTHHDTLKTASTLVFYALGLTGYFAQQVLTRAFYSMQDSTTPARSAVIAVFTNIALNLFLIWPLGTAGLAAATALCSYLQVFILAVTLARKLQPTIFHGLAVGLAKTAIATFIMVAPVALLLAWLRTTAPIFQLLTAVPLAVLLYLLAARVLKIEMLSLVTARWSSSDDTDTTD